MFKQKMFLAVGILGFTFAVVGLLSRPMPAQTRTSVAVNLDQAASNTLAAARKALLDAAATHKVTVQAERAVYVSDQGITLIHAPLQGIEKYQDADFTAGVPVMLIIIKSAEIKSTEASRALNGSYVVRAQFQPGASSGKATFIDSKGKIARQRELIIKTGGQFPLNELGTYSRQANPKQDGGLPVPAEIPVITSTHCAHPSHPDSSCYVDCSGWSPPRTLYFSMY
jgi:hypothetical protein